MFSHIALGSNDIEKSRRFYDGLMGALGAAPATTTPDDRLVYSHGGGLLIVGAPRNGEAATFANGGTIGFNAETEEQVKAWHDAGVANGGKSCEDPPGIRDVGAMKLYLAYLRDPDGNKLCAMKPVA